MLTPEQLQAIRERAEYVRHGETSWLLALLGNLFFKKWHYAAEDIAWDDIPALLSHIDELESKFAVIWRAYTDAVQKNVLLKSNFQDSTPSA